MIPYHGILFPDLLSLVKLSEEHTGRTILYDGSRRMCFAADGEKREGESEL
jgi:hypothetical protein